MIINKLIKNLFKKYETWNYVVDDDSSFIDTFVLDKVDPLSRKQLKMRLIEKLKQIASYYFTNSIYSICNQNDIINYGDRLIYQLNGVNNLAILFEDFYKSVTNMGELITFLIYKIEDKIEKDPDFISLNSIFKINPEKVFSIRDFKIKINDYIKSNKIMNIEFEEILNVDKIEKYIDNNNICKKCFKTNLNVYKNILRDSLIVLSFYKTFYNYYCSNNVIIRYGIISYPHLEWINPYFDEDLSHKSLVQLKKPVNPMIKVSLRPIEELNTETTYYYNILYEEKK